MLPSDVEKFAEFNGEIIFQIRVRPKLAEISPKNLAQTPIRENKKPNAS